MSRLATCTWYSVVLSEMMKLTHTYQNHAHYPGRSVPILALPRQGNGAVRWKRAHACRDKVDQSNQPMQPFSRKQGIARWPKKRQMKSGKSNDAGAAMCLTCQGFSPKWIRSMDMVLLLLQRVLQHHQKSWGKPTGRAVMDPSHRNCRCVGKGCTTPTVWTKCVGT